MRDIRRRAVEAEPNDHAGLNALISEIQHLRSHSFTIYSARR
jgi:hypothetical protein